MVDIREIAKQCRALTAELPGLPQYDLLNDDKFAKLLTDRLHGIYWGHYVFRLWRSGLLRTDFLVSNDAMNIQGIDTVPSMNGQIYVDNRPVPYRASGWGASLSGDGQRLSNALRGWFQRIVLRLLRKWKPNNKWRPVPRPNPTFSSINASGFFHPFRIYSVYVALKITTAQTSTLQYLLNDRGLLSIAKLYRKLLNKSTSEATFTEGIEFANCLSELCVVLEPVAYQSIFRSVRWSHPETEESIQERIAERLEMVGTILDSLGLDQIDELRRALCREAEIVDGNKRLHLIIRLMRSSERNKLKGDIGLSMTFLTMAEVLRRAAEKHFAVCLQEEDELGFGQWMPGARKLLYGTDRLLDANRIDRVTFLQQMGLNHGTKIRCYVEGRTEAAALNYAFEPYRQIAVVDLGGQVIEKRGKGLAFRDSLRRDIREQVFSFVFIDGDLAENLSTVKQAARHNEIVGAFFVSDPDFELENFTFAELLDVVCEIAEIDLLDQEKQELLDSVSRCISASEFFSILGNEDSRLARATKGAIWGERLMALALSAGGNGDDERSIVQAVRLVLTGLHVGYSMHKDEYRTDVESGLPFRIEQDA